MKFQVFVHKIQQLTKTMYAEEYASAGDTFGLILPWAIICDVHEMSNSCQNAEMSN